MMLIFLAKSFGEPIGPIHFISQSNNCISTKCMIFHHWALYMQHLKLLLIYGIHLGSRLKQGIPCLKTLLTMTIWVNSPHIVGRLGVALFFESLFTLTIPSTTTMLRYPGWRIQHLVPNLSAIYHQQSNCHHH